jgi:hypothetical protein
MKLYFHITKTGNLFHFISNLVDWHFSVRSSYKKYWLKKTGNLTSEDKIWLNKAKVLFQEHGFSSNNNWSTVLLRRPEDDLWQVAEERFGKKDTDRFREIHDYFLPRFEKIWPAEKKLLSSWENKLQESLGTYTPNALLDDLNTLFGVVPDFSNDIKVILLLSSPASMGGGANVGKGGITLEISNMQLEKTKEVWLLFWHELIHVYWERNNEYMNMIKNYLDKTNITSFSKNIPAKVVIKEAVMESLIPYGFLAQRHFSFKSKAHTLKKLQDYVGKKRLENSMSYWRRYSLIKMLDIAKEYVEKKKPIDKNYLNKVAQALEEFKKEPLVKTR